MLVIRKWRVFLGKFSLWSMCWIAGLLKHVFIKKKQINTICGSNYSVSNKYVIMHVSYMNNGEVWLNERTNHLTLSNDIVHSFLQLLWQGEGGITFHPPLSEGKRLASQVKNREMGGCCGISSVRKKTRNVCSPSITPKKDLGTAQTESTPLHIK